MVRDTPVVLKHPMQTVQDAQDSVLVSDNLVLTAYGDDTFKKHALYMRKIGYQISYK